MKKTLYDRIVNLSLGSLAMTALLIDKMPDHRALLVAVCVILMTVCVVLYFRRQFEVIGLAKKKPILSTVSTVAVATPIPVEHAPVVDHLHLQTRYLDKLATEANAELDLYLKEMLDDVFGSSDGRGDALPTDWMRSEPKKRHQHRRFTDNSCALAA